MSNKAGVERETWGEMGAKDRGGSDTSWCVDRYELTRACSAVSFCHPSSSVCPSVHPIDPIARSDRIASIRSDWMRHAPSLPRTTLVVLMPRASLPHARAAAAAAVVVVGGRVAIATSRRRGSLVHARARALARRSLPPTVT